MIDFAFNHITDMADKKECSMKTKIVIEIILIACVLMTTVQVSAKEPAVDITGVVSSNIQFQQIVSGIAQPVFITNANDGSGRLFIIEKAGRIRIFKNGTLLQNPFLDIQTIVNSSGAEQGLLTLAFHPDFLNNGQFYIVYTNANNSLVLSKFSRSSIDPDQADPTSEEIILTIPKIYLNHNGGTLAFGPDGYLYWSIGDGGSGGDPDNNAQNLGSLLGKILRLDIDNGTPYSIPTTNPFYNSSDLSIRKEIWAYGLRNPWRFSFDRDTGNIFIGDVGQDKWEEIDFQPASSLGGENYGWRILEGTHCYNPPSGCTPPAQYTPPIYEYPHTLITHDDNGCSVTGGYVYRGMKYLPLLGKYFFGDFCKGTVSFLSNTATGWQAVLVADTSFVISSFGEDEQGELYLADYNTGIIYQIQYKEGNATDSTHDFNGDGKDDSALFRPSNGIWYLRKIGFYVYGTNGDIPVPANYDGGNMSETAVFRPSNNTWYIHGYGPFTYGQAGDEPVPSDYNGDGLADIAMFRPSTGYWHVRGQGSYLYGTNGDIPVPGDYNGDGKDDIAVFRPSTGYWYVRGQGFYLYGTDGDIPVPGDYNGDGKDDIVVFRPSTGYWYVRGQGSYLYGTNGDIPAD